MNALLISGDLLIGSQAAGVAEHVGADLHVARTNNQAVTHCQQNAVELVLIDLSTGGVEIDSLVDQLRNLEGSSPRIAAFGPHVHAAKLRAARDAGCDEVFSRGELHAKLEEILSA